MACAGAGGYGNPPHPNGARRARAAARAAEGYARHPARCPSNIPRPDAPRREGRGHSEHAWQSVTKQQLVFGSVCRYCWQVPEWRLLAGILRLGFLFSQRFSKEMLIGSSLVFSLDRSQPSVGLRVRICSARGRARTECKRNFELRVAAIANRSPHYIVFTPVLQV